MAMTVELLLDVAASAEAMERVKAAIDKEDADALFDALQTVELRARYAMRRMAQWADMLRRPDHDPR